MLFYSTWLTICAVFSDFTPHPSLCQIIRAKQLLSPHLTSHTHHSQKYFSTRQKTNAQLLASNNIPKHGDLENIFSDLISDYLSPVVEATANQSISGDEWQTGRCFFPNFGLWISVFTIYMHALKASSCVLKADKQAAKVERSSKFSRPRYIYLLVTEI